MKNVRTETYHSDTPRQGVIDKHDASLLVRNLSLTPEERFERFLDKLAFLRDLRQAKRVTPDER